MFKLVVNFAAKTVGQKANRDLARFQYSLIYFITLLLVIAQFFFNNAYANPENPVVTAGQANIETQPNGVMQVNQTSSNAIVNWSSFNIAPHEHTHFQQPAGGVILNRVNSSRGASEILGQLSATGTVVLVNPAGVLFGENARVDVASIITSTADISDQNFMQCKYIFDRAGLPSASIINKGNISARENGLVALIGYGIRNDGLIQGKLGKVILAHGEKFTVDMYGDQLISFTVDSPAINPAIENLGVKNSGIIQADGSEVLLTAQAAADVLDQVINMNGIIEAKSVKEHAGKIIFLSDEHGSINISGKVDVSSTECAGGEISTYGKAVTISPEANLNASGSDQGGKVILKSKEATKSYGKTIACAGEHGGTGGTIEFSSDGIVDFDPTQSDTRAISGGIEVGTRGNLIIDPRFMVVQTGGITAYLNGVNNLFGNNSSGTTTLTPASIVTASILSSIVLQANTDVVLVDALNLSGLSSALTIQAGRSVLIQSPVSTNNGTISITANDSSAVSANRLTTSASNPPGDTETVAGNIVMSGSGTLSSGTGALNLTVGSSNTAPFTSGTMTLLGLTSGALTINTPNAANCSASISATTLTKQGNGVLTMSAANTISTSIAVTAGTVRASISSGLGATASGISVTNGATLDLNFSSATLGNTSTLTLNGTGVGSAGSLTLTGNSITVNSPLTISTSTLVGGVGAGVMTFGGTATGASNSNLTYNLANAGLSLSTVTLAGTGILSVTGGGALTQTGLFTVPGVSSFSSGSNPITLLQNNQLTGAITFSNSGSNNISLTNNRATVLAASSVGQNFALTSAGAVTQTGVLTVQGTSSFSAGAFPITLNQNNLFTGALSFNNTGANAVSITNAQGLVFGTSSTGNNLTATATGAITQTGILTVAGTSGFNAGSNPITLTQNNLLTGAVTLNNSAANDVSLINNRATVLAASTVGQNFALNSVGALTQTGILTVPGTSSFNSNAFAMTLTQGNVLTGAITLSNSGANNVSLTNNRATLLATSTLGQNLDLISVGAITQNGILTVPGTSSFSAVANAITLGLNNLLTGAVTLNNSGANDVSLFNNRATILAASTIGQNLTVTSVGSLTQTGIITVPGTSIFSSGAFPITLTQNNALTGAISLSNSGANNVSLTNNRATVFGVSTLGQNLTVTSVGALTQSGVLTVPGVSSFAAGAFPITLTQSNVLGGAITLSNSGANAVALTNSIATVLAASTLGQDFTLTSGGSVTQTGALTASGGTLNISSAAVNSDVILSQFNNLGTAAPAFGGTLTNIRDVSLTNVNSGAELPSFDGLTNLRNLTLNFTTAAIELPAVSMLGSLSVSAGGAITQSGVLTIPGTSNFTVGDFPITLTQNNLFTGAVSFTNTSTNAVSITNAQALVLGVSSTANNLAVNAAGAITQTGILNVAGTSSFTSDANPITLTLNNQLVGAVSFSNSGANDVTLINNRATVLGASTLGNNYSMTATGAVTQTGILTIPGTASFTSGVFAMNLTQNNVITGAITLSNSGANDVSLTNNRATLLALSTVGQNLTVISDGSLTQTGILTVPGTSSFISGAFPITLIQNNVLTGAITLSNSGANNVSLTNNRATVLAASSVGQNLSVNSVGSLTQTGALTVPGISSFIAGANPITLTQNNFFTDAIAIHNSGANDVNLTNTLATVLSASTVGKNCVIISGGSITQTGPLTATGPTLTVSSTAANSNVLLTQNNDLGTTATVFAGTLGNIRDVTITNVNAGASAPDLSALTSLRNLTLNFANSAIALPAVTLVNSGSLNLTSGGAITQSGIFTVPGTSSINSGSFPITLTQNNLFTGAISLSNSGANNVSLINNLPTVLAASTVGQNLAVTSSGSLTQTGTLTVLGTSSFNSGAFPMTLTQNNSLTGAISVSNSGANNVNLTNTLPTILASSTLGQDFTLISGSSVTQTGALTVAGGILTLSSTAPNSDILLTEFNDLGTSAPTFAGTLGNIRDVSITNIYSGATLPILNTLTSLRNLTINFTTAAVSIPAATLISGGSLSVSSGGAITQAGILTVPGTSSFSSGANPITLTLNNILTGAVAFSNSGTNDVTLTNNRATVLAASSLGQNLSVTAAGSLTQSGALTVPGTSSFTAGGSPITLTQNNLLTGVVTLSNSGANNISLTNTLATSLGAATLGQNFTLISGGSVTQTGELTATGGALTISSTAANSDIILGQANDLGTTAPVFSGTLSNIRDLSLTNTNAGAVVPVLSTLSNLRNLTLNFANTAIALPTVTLTNSGSLSLTSGGDITQTGIATVPGTSSFNTGSFAITLTQNNVFTGAVSLSNSGTNTASLTNNRATVLAASTLGQNLTVSSAGALTQTGILTVPGTSSFTSGSFPMTLIQNNVLTGDIILNNSGANNVSLTNTLPTILAASTLGQDFTLISGGSVTQTGALVESGGVLTISSTVANSDILLNQANSLGSSAPVFTGTLGNIRDISLTNTDSSATLSALSSLRNLTLNFANSAITLPEATLTSGGALSLIAGGAITQSGVLTVPGNSSFTAGAFPITLTQNNLFTGTIAINNSGANDVYLTNTLATILGTSSIGKNYTITSGGSVTQTGALSENGGVLTISSTNTNSDIILSQANDLGTAEPVFSGTLGNLRDLSLTNINAGAAVPVLSTLSSLRNLALNFANTAIALPTVTLTNSGALSVTSGGAITQTGTATVPGTSSFSAGASPITLAHNNIFTGAVALNNSGTNDVTINNTQALGLSSGSIGQNLTVTANGNITQTGTLTINNIASFDSGSANTSLANLISIGEFNMVGNNVTGAVNVGGMQLETNLANMTGTVAGLTGTDAIAIIVNVNPITMGTHFFDGFDMYNSQPPPPPPPPAPIPTGSSQAIDDEMKSMVENLLYYPYRYSRTPKVLNIEEAHYVLADPAVGFETE